MNRNEAGTVTKTGLLLTDTTFFEGQSLDQENSYTEESPVTDDILFEQAELMERLLPAIMRHIFTIDPNHPLSDLPLGQFRLCMLLFREGKRTMSQVSEELGISVSAVTQMADRLEKVGLVERVAESHGDRRTRYLRLSGEGLSLMESRRHFRLARAQETLRLLTPEQRERTLEVLEGLRSASRSLPTPESATDTINKDSE